MAMITIEEFTEKANLSKHQVRTWLESGLLDAKTVNGPDGPSQEFDAGQLERARLLKALYAKGVSRGNTREAAMGRKNDDPPLSNAQYAMLRVAHQGSLRLGSGPSDGQETRAMPIFRTLG